MATKLSALEYSRATQKVKAREIASEIIKFGVTQVQLLYIIKLLSLELEDMKLVRELGDVIKKGEWFAMSGSEKIDDSPKKTKIYM